MTLASFKQFLDEAVQPFGGDAKQENEFAARIADIYDKAPEIDQGVVPAYTFLRNHINFLWQELNLRGRVEFKWTSDDPYSNAEEMIEDVNNGQLLVYSGFNNHPILSEEENLRFRALHDYYGHYIKRLPFSYSGELSTYYAHKRVAVPAILPALFSEIIGQASYTHTRGDFPKQKVVDFRPYVNMDNIADEVF